MSIPILICIRVPNLVPIVLVVWHISRILLMFAPSNPFEIPLECREFYFSRCPFPDESSYVKFGPHRSSGLEAYQYLLIEDPLTPPPCSSGIEGLMFSPCPFQDEYAYVCQICSRSVGPIAVWHLSPFLNL